VSPLRRTLLALGLAALLLVGCGYDTLRFGADAATRAEDVALMEDSGEPSDADTALSEEGAPGPDTVSGLMDTLAETSR